MSGSVVLRSVIMVGSATATIEPSIENISTPITHSAYRRYPRCQERSAAPISWSSSLNHRWRLARAASPFAAEFLSPKEIALVPRRVRGRPLRGTEIIKTVNFSLRGTNTYREECAVIRIASYISPKATKGQPSAIAGRGLFAVAPIGKDEIVAIKGGHIVDAQTLAQNAGTVG